MHLAAENQDLSDSAVSLLVWRAGLGVRQCIGAAIYAPIESSAAGCASSWCDREPACLISLGVVPYRLRKQRLK
jgi:hypothetical protein